MKERDEYGEKRRDHDDADTPTGRRRRRTIGTRFARRVATDNHSFGNAMTFEEFMPLYLEAHVDRRTQIVHAAGTASAVAVAAYALATRRPAWIAAALVCGYVPAWFSHWFIERNVPKTFAFPTYSLRADFVMAYRLVRGRV
jgi:hypothetical protein